MSCCHVFFSLLVDENRLFLAFSERKVSASKPHAELGLKTGNEGSKKRQGRDTRKKPPDLIERHPVSKKASTIPDMNETIGSLKF